MEGVHASRERLGSEVGLVGGKQFHLEPRWTRPLGRRIAFVQIPREVNSQAVRQRWLGLTPQHAFHTAQSPRRLLSVFDGVLLFEVDAVYD